jgi:hypothetical protein
LTGNAGNPVRLQLLLGQPDAAVAGETESSLRDSRDVSEPPVFVVSAWEPDFAKAGKRILAQLPQPWQAMAGGKLLELAEAFQVTF